MIYNFDSIATEATVAATLAMENANLTPRPHTDNSTSTSGNATEATPSFVKQANLINEKGDSDTFKKAEKERIKYEQDATTFNTKAEKNESKVDLPVPAEIVEKKTIEEADLAGNSAANSANIVDTVSNNEQLTSESKQNKVRTAVLDKEDDTAKINDDKSSIGTNAGKDKKHASQQSYLALTGLGMGKKDGTKNNNDQTKAIETGIILLIHQIAALIFVK